MFGVVAAIGGALVAAAASLLWLARPVRVDPERRAALAAAVAAVDRELAANLELTTMFDQTKHAVVLESGEFERHRETLERDAGSVAVAVAALYARIPATESAMERRGPAQSLREDDRRLIEGWEGDARDAQHALRDALNPRPLSGWAALTARLSGFQARR